MTTPSTAAFDVHTGLLSQIDEINQWWPDSHQRVIGGVNIHEIHSRLDKLRASLELHFAEEERGGLLPEEFGGDPRFVSESERLLQQHADLRRQLESVIRHVPPADGSVAQWTLAKREFEICRESLRAHEQAESLLLENAFLNVSGTVD